MIYLEMHGRLGNQMFQYAAAKALQIETNQSIGISFRKVIGANSEGTVGWNNSLEDFCVGSYSTIDDCKNLFKKLNSLKKILCIIYAVSYKPYMKNIQRWYQYQLKWCPLLDKFGIRWLANGYYKFCYTQEKDILLNGAFEAPQYFDNIRNILINEFQPKEDRLEKNKKLYCEIESENSVCVSLRHFKLEGQQKRLYEVCSREYYRSAIKEMKRKVSDPHFIFFSDDIEWIKEVIDTTGLSYSIETKNNPVWEKLRLMYSCKHFIIPNSTFAWWAQYLGRYDNKVVISPAKWFNDAFESPLIDPRWIRIDVNGKVL